jgi:chromosome segregation ATPase
MQQDKLISELQSLERKVKLLMGKYQALQEENSLLKSENEDLRSIVRMKQEKINNFQNKIKISKIVDTIAVEQDEATELKQTIDEYIKEIDKCIAHLGE